MALHLFIDTNIYLSFYHFSNDDIESIDKLVDRIVAGEIVLHLPRQVENEWERNREIKLNNAANEFQKVTFQTQIPRHMHDLSMAKTYLEAVTEAKRARDHLIAEANAKARTSSLKVDLLLLRLFDVAIRHEDDDEIYDLGKTRAERGNPPGKPGSIGDQYIWEMLLAKVPGVDLYVITKDGDYGSPLGGKDETGVAYPHPFLKREWFKRKENANLYIFESIKTLLVHYNKTIVAAAAPAAAPNEHIGRPQQVVEPVQPVEDANVGEQAGEQQQVPEVIEADAALTPQQREEKTAAIEALVHSPNFQMTHNAIANLTPWVQFFTKADADRLAEAAVDNRQIGWIITDGDVNQFYLRLLSEHIAELDAAHLDNLIELLGLSPDEPEEEQAADSF
jgi:hypothetical protein